MRREITRVWPQYTWSVPRLDDTKTYLGTVIIGDPVRGSCKRAGFRDVVFNVYMVSHPKRTPYTIPYPLVFDLLYRPELLLVLALQSLRVTGKGAFQRWREAMARSTSLCKSIPSFTGER